MTEVKLSELLLKLNCLKIMPRTGWFFCNVPPSEVEDVAQHSFAVTTITMFLTDELKREGGEIDGERAVNMAILHDWAEAEVADFPYTAQKYLASPEVKTRMERGALKEMLQENPEKEKYQGLWEEYMEKKTLESRIVHAADYLSILVQAIKYRERGIRSKEIEDLWIAVKKDLEPYSAEFKIIKKIEKELSSIFRAQPSSL